MTLVSHFDCFGKRERDIRYPRERSIGTSRILLVTKKTTNLYILIDDFNFGLLSLRLETNNYYILDLTTIM